MISPVIDITSARRVAAPAPERTLPYLVAAPRGALSSEPLTAFVTAHLPELREALLVHGAVLLRGFQLTQAEAFAEVAELVGGPLGSQYEGPSPRKLLSGSVYTASEVPGPMVVAEHAEMSYLPEMPRHLFFWCKTPAAVGGATTLADGRRVLAELDPARVGPLLEAPLRIRRRHARPRGFHDPFELKRWPSTFGAGDLSALSARLAALGVTARFEADGALTLESRQPAVRAHPETKERAWLNHLLVFHASAPAATLESAVRNERDLRAAALYPVAYAYRKLMPLLGREVATDVRLDDGAPISDETLGYVRSVVDRVAVPVQWQRGDLVIVDNHLVLHGRRPFWGKREVAVAWSDARA